MAQQKHPTPAARVRRTQVSQAVAQAHPKDDDEKVSGQSDMDVVFITVKKDGKETSEPISLHRSVLATISSGMATADKLETTWREGADSIIRDFFGEAIPKGTKPEITKYLREHAMFDAMYQVFVQRHPKYAQAQKWLDEAKAGGSEGDKSKAAYNDAIGKIRSVAQMQAVRVVGYYAEAHAADKAAQQREQETARSLIEAARKDWANRVLTGRGNFGEEQEKKLLNAAIDALGVVLDNDRLERAARLAEANRLSLKKPDDDADDVAGTEEDYEAAHAA